MSFTAWRRALNALFPGRYRPGRRLCGQVYRPRQGYVPCIEVLEDRLTPSAIITVNSLLDVDTRDNVLTFREAIEINNRTLDVSTLTAAEQLQVNGTPTAADSDTINFSIASGVQTIQLQSDLPAITDSVVIDGSSQPGFSGTPLIELRGANNGLLSGLFVVLAGNSTVSSLVINSSRTSGILLSGLGGNLIVDNYIGTDVSGSTAMPNQGSGVDIEDSPNNTIRRNVISGNLTGISISGSSSVGNTVVGNFIGTDRDGDDAIPNILGIRVNSAFCTIGGPNPSDGNVISGNRDIAIFLDSNAAGAVIQRNIVGLTANGGAPLGNGGGLVILSNTNLVGGASGEGNIISANAGDAIVVSGSETTIQGNFIGTGPGGVGSLGNTGNGITIGNAASGVAAFNTTVGGINAGEGNVIAFNEGNGVAVSFGDGNPILGNSIFGNFGIGIDLGNDGVTINDADDTDIGPNNFQNFPILDSATATSSGLQIDGEFHGAPVVATYRLEFFSSDSADASGFGEGQTFLGFLDITTDSAGDATFSFTTNPVPAMKVLTATATDASSNTSEFSQGILSPNNPPVLSPIGNTTIDELTPLTFTAFATDPDSPPQQLTFSLTSAPSGASIDPTTGFFSWMPTEADGPGMFTITVRVADDGTPSLFDERSFTVTVNEVNQPPSITPISDMQVDEETLLDFTVQVNDPDLPANTLTFSLVSPPNGVSIDPNSGEFAWTPAENQGPGVFSITVLVTDNAGGSDQATLKVTVNEVNKPPVLNAIGDKMVDEGTLLTFTATANDPDIPANGLRFNLINAPQGANIDPNTGKFTWTPTEAQGPGVFPVTVRVTDNGNPNLFDEEAIKITVNEINQPPVLNPIGNKSVDENTTLSFAATATDPDLPPNKLTFSLIGAPSGAAIDPTSGKFTFTPSESDGGNNFIFTVRVTDDGKPNLFDEEQITVTVKDTNQPPVLDFIGDRVVDEETLLSFQATAHDDDIPADSLTFSIFNAPAGSTFDPAMGIFTWIPTETDGPGVFPVTIRVTDSGSPNLFDEETFNIVVREVNRPPVLDPIPDQFVDEETLLTFTATASDPDIPENQLTFSLIGAPPGASIDPTTGVFSWIPTEAQGPGVYVVTVRVTDNGGGTAEGVVVPDLFDEQQVTITVREVNRPPVLAPIPNRIVNVGTLVNPVATATDPDLPPNTLTFSLDNAPVGATIDPATGAIAWTANQGLGDFNFRVRITDNGHPDLSDTTDFTVTVVNPPPAPPPPSLTSNGSDVLIALVRESRDIFNSVPFFEALSLLAPPDVTPIAFRRFEDPFTPLVGMSASVAQEVLGEISGHVFLDLNGNGKQDDGEPGLRGQRVFLDQNDNGIPDESEPTVETDGNGRYHFSGLQLTRYRVRQDLRNRRILQTEPEKNAAHEIELTIDINSIPNVDFGAKLLPATASAPADYETPAPASPVRVTPDTPAPAPRDGERPVGPARNGAQGKNDPTKPPPPPREE